MTTYNASDVSALLAAIRRNDAPLICSIAELFGAPILNALVRHPEPGVHARNTSPLLYAMELPDNELWMLLLSLGADPMQPVDEEDSSPFFKAVQLNHIDFLSMVRFDPLREYRMLPGSYVPIKHIFEEGWGQGAEVALNICPPFDANLAWSEGFPRPPQTFLYRAAFHAMDGLVIPTLIDEFGADPLCLNQAGQTLVHAVVFGAKRRLDEARRFSKVCDAILDAGANPRLRDAFGRLPLEMACDLTPSPTAKAVVSSIRANMRLRTTVQIISRTSQTKSSPFFGSLSSDVVHIILEALYPDYQRACNIIIMIDRGVARH